MAAQAQQGTTSAAETRIRQQLRALKNNVDEAITLFSSGSDAAQVLNTMRFLTQVVAVLETVNTAPGMVDAGKNASGDPSYDIVVEVGIIITTVNTALTNIVALIPKQNGFILTHKIVNYEVVPRSLSGAQLSNVIAELNTISAAIIV